MDFKMNVKKVVLTYFGFHSPKTNSGLCAKSDGLLVPRVEDVNQLGIVCSWRAVIQS